MPAPAAPALRKVTVWAGSKQPVRARAYMAALHSALEASESLYVERGCTSRVIGCQKEMSRHLAQARLHV